MYILGIGCFYHDASACIIKDGVLIAAAEEERFTRIKHDLSFPINAIRFCLKEAGISIDDVSMVTYYEKPLIKLERFLFSCIATAPRSYAVFLKAIPSYFTEKLRVPKLLRKKLSYKGDVVFIPHHMAHAASSFFLSSFDDAVILTVDGVGEYTTTAYGFGKGNEILLEKEISFPYSLGLLYSTITAYLGFTVNNGEYKVMGLSSYGEMDERKNPYINKLRKVITIKEDGSFSLDMSYFCYHYKEKMPSKKLCTVLGGPIRKGGDITHRHKQIAAAVQYITEEIVLKMINFLYKKYQSKNLCLAGGVALNSVLNGKILSKTPFSNIFIPPNPGDGGASVGAAYYYYNSILGKERKSVLKTASLGPGYTDEEVRSFLVQNKIVFKEFKDDSERVEEVARLIYKDNVVAFFEGRMEFGPRALGNRSILANPCNKNMKEILNSKVKHREGFRPFAPVVAVEDVNPFFVNDDPIPDITRYMLMVYPIKKEFWKKVPSVTHVDGTGRLQAIIRDDNPFYYDIIKEFGKLSGIPMLINTSFNIRGEPIVCTPDDAYKCMMGTGIDYLVIGKYLIKRSDNPNDIWDSEEFATD